MNAPDITALIAEDEPVLARGLLKMLRRLWPALRVCAVVHDGNEAVQQALEHLPDIVFLDIRMPERDGLEACEQISDAWPQDRPLPLTVFVTAFDRFAIDAFERAAVDYVLKPMEEDRLALTCKRLADRLVERRPRDDAAALAPLMALLNTSPQPAQRGSAPLELIQASVGSTLHMVNVSEVLYFEADDKYVCVVTADKTLFIRTPLRELLPRLAPGLFMQINRGIAVRASLIDRVVREDNGRIQLHLKGAQEPLPVSRSHAHLFKPM